MRLLSSLVGLLYEVLRRLCQYRDKGQLPYDGREKTGFASEMSPSYSVQIVLIAMISKLPAEKVII